MTRALAIIAMLMGQMAIACAPGTLNVCTHADGRSHVEFSYSKCHHGHAGSSHLHDDCVPSGLARVVAMGIFPDAVCEHLATEGSAAAGSTVAGNSVAGDHDCGNCTDRPLVCEQSSQRYTSAKATVYLVCDCPMAGSPTGVLDRSAAADFFQSSLPASAILADLATVMLRC